MPIGYWGRVGILALNAIATVMGARVGWEVGFPNKIPPGFGAAFVGAIYGVACVVLVLGLIFLARGLWILTGVWLDIGREIDEDRKRKKQAIAERVERQAGQLSESPPQGELSLCSSQSSQEE